MVTSNSQSETKLSKSLQSYYIIPPSFKGPCSPKTALRACVFVLKRFFCQLASTFEERCVTTVKCFDSSIYYFMLILRKLRYVFCNRCVTLSLGFAKDRFANNSGAPARAKRARSGAPWVRKFGKPSIPEKLVMT